MSTTSSTLAQIDEPHRSQFDEAKNGVTVDSVIYNRVQKFWWVCEKGHSYQMNLRNKLVLDQHCCYCTNRKLLKGFNDLQTVRPDLAKEWADDETKPDEVFSGSVKLYKWRCAEGHVWEDSPNHRKDPRRGCPFCSNHRVLAGWNDVATKFPELMSEWASPDLDPTQFTHGSKVVVTWECAKGHTWKASILSRTIKGTGCQECKRLNREQRKVEREEQKATTKAKKRKQNKPSRVLQVDAIPSTRKLRPEPNKFRYLAYTHPEIAAYLVNPEDGYKVTHYSKKVLEWRCSAGHEFSEQVGVVFELRKHCPVCTGRRLIVGVTDLATTNPELARELVDPDDAFRCHRSSNKEFEWMCSKGHTWKATVNRRAAGCNCPICSNKKVIAGINDIWTTHPKIAQELIDPSLGYKLSYGSRKKVEWRCIKEHRWKTTVSARVGSNSTSGNNCPKCSKSQSYLEQLVLSVVQEVYFGEVRCRKRPIKTAEGNPRELDIWLPDLKIAFEVQDFRTHSKDNDTILLSGHRYPQSRGYPVYKHGPTYHAEKRYLAMKQLGVKVCEVWEDEILDGSYRDKVADVIGRAIASQSSPGLDSSWL